MTIFYAVVARGKTVLVEHTGRSGNFPTVARMILAEIPAHDDKRSLSHERNYFHYLVADGITYLCLADEADKQRVPFNFLDDIRQRFTERYGGRARTAIAFAMNQEFQPELQHRIDYFNTSPESDKIRKVKEDLESVKGTMRVNIEKVIQRGDKVELLVEKTQQLSVSASRFQKSSKDLKNVMCRQNARLTILLAVVVVVVIWLIISLVCKFDFSKCK